MNQNKKREESIQIDCQSTIIQAIQQMDIINRKLLIVNKQNSFLGILSIGDIQRAILNKIDLQEAIEKILRANIAVAKESDSKEEIIATMLKYRTEFMPILDADNQLIDVIFWEDILKEKNRKEQIKEDLPVVIMAGGKGSRLKPITNIIPKPLVPVGDKTFVEIIMNSFLKNGLSNFLFSVNYKADLIKYYFENNDKQYSIAYFEEEKALGTAGSLALMKDHINSSFFISNCDIIVDQDYHEIYKYHKENKNDLTAVAAIKSYNIPYGTMDIGKNGLLQSLSEKPEFTYYVNAGLYILEPHLLDLIPSNQFFHITDLMEQIVSNSGRVGVFPVTEGSWMDIGEWQNYNETQERFKKGSSYGEKFI